nr:f-box protein [Quercus suber]
MLIGSANGLFSLYEQERFILWNPSIRKFITLPKPSSYFGSCRQAFGFDPRTNDYKVVRIAFPNSTDMSEEAKPHLIEIYSLNEGSWRITSAPFPPGIWFSDWRLPAASLNGAVHFAVYDENIPSCQLVLSFDLGDEVFRLIPLPNGAFGWSVHTLVIGGSLSLLCYDICKNKCCSIWVMKEYGVVDSWTKQFTINLNGGEMFRVFGLQGNGNILFEAKVPIGWELSSYDPKSEQGKNLGICGRPFHFCVDNYMENLVLLNRPNDTVFERRVSRKRKCRSTSDKERVRRLEERVCQQKTLMPLLETILKQLTGNGKTDRENDHLKSQLIILIQQLRGQSGDMFSGAGDQSATQVQLGSPSANQEM